MNVSTSPQELRPLAMGELVDHTVSFWRTHFGTLFRLYLGYELASFALLKGCTLLIRHWLPLFRGGRALQQAMHADPTGATAQIAIGGSISMAMLALIWGTNWIASVAGTRYAVDRLLGRPASLEAGLRRAWTRLGTTALAFLLSLLWGLGILLLCLLPGGALTVVGALAASSSLAGALAALFGVLLMLLGTMVAMLWYVLRFLLTPQVLAMEDVGAFAAVRRSGQLISGRVGPGFLDLVKVRATILVTVVSLLLLAVYLVSVMPALILQLVYGHIFDPARSDPGAVPEAMLIPAELLQVGVQAIFTPLFLLFCALFYVDMRVRREGLDLELKLGTLGSPARGQER